MTNSSPNCSSLIFENDCDCIELTWEISIKCVKQDDQIEFDLSKLVVNTNKYVKFAVQINNKKIPRLGEFLFENSSFELLDFSSNQIEAISNLAFDRLNHLNRLNLANNRLKTIENLISSISNNERLDRKLTVINLSYNLVEKIDSKFGKQFANLTTLDFHSNRIRFIVNEAFHSLINLNYLNLGGNSLLSISRFHFTGIEKIERFILNNNDMPLDFEIENLDTIIEFDLRNSKIKNISINNVNDSRSIFLQNNKIERINRGNFKRLQKVNSLALNHNSISYIEDFAFSSCAFLRTLDISNNQLEELRPNMFFNLSSLHTLRLEFNKIKVIQGFVFEFLMQLTQLSLNQNQIRKIEKNGFFNLNHLSMIELSDNRLHVYSKELFQFVQNISSLVLLENFVTSDAFQYLEKLHVLKLIQSDFENITNKTFNHIRQLETLFITNCKISKLETHFLHNLPALTTVKIDNNIILEFGEFLFVNLSKLSKLEFTDNGLRLLHQNLFVKLTNLETLNLRSNKIQGIKSGALFGIPNLKNMDLSFNYLKEIKETHFEGLSNLTSLNLSNNQILYINKDSFASLVNLRDLDLSQNYLNQLPKLLFKQMTRLEQINLNGNHFKFIEKGYFSNLPCLKKLNLDNNNIEQIEENGIYLQNSLELSLSNNRLGHFSGASNLVGNSYTHVIDLSHNRFVNLSKVKYNQGIFVHLLDLSHNSIEIVLTGDIDRFALLAILNISHNQLKILDTQFHSIYNFRIIAINVSIDMNFTNFKGLKSNELDLSFNRILNIQQNLSSFIPSLLKLRLESCEFLDKTSLNIDMFAHLEEFKGGFLKGFRQFDLRLTRSNHSKLRILSLAGMNISDISMLRLDLFDSLEELNLSYNKIAFLRRDFFPVRNNLSILDLSHNKLRIMNKSFFENLKSLSFLDLRFNQIEYFDIDYFDLSMLKSILLASNLLREFFCTSDHFMDKMFSIDLSSNQVTNFQVIMKNLPKTLQVKEIYLDHNLISELKDDNFILFPLLETLYLNDNKIEQIQKDAFRDCNQIKQLALNQNYLEYLNTEVFGFMKNMESLNLSSNRLRFINKELFAFMINLKELDLSHNLIYQIDDFAFNRLIRLNVLYLQGNENLSFNESSLFGLTSIKSVHLPFTTLLKRENIKYLVDALRPKWSKTIGLRRYYESIFIQSYPHTSSNQTDELRSYECNLTIIFIKFNLNLNLKNEMLYASFIEKCFKMKLSDEELNSYFSFISSVNN